MKKIDFDKMYNKTKVSMDEIHTSREVEKFISNIKNLDDESASELIQQIINSGAKNVTHSLSIANTIVEDFAEDGASFRPRFKLGDKVIYLGDKDHLKGRKYLYVVNVYRTDYQVGDKPSDAVSDNTGFVLPSELELYRE